MSNAAEGLKVPHDVLALFDGQVRLGHMSTLRPDGHMSVVPVGVLIHDGKLKISSPTRTRKIRNLRHDPHIAVCIMDPANPQRYVMIRGTALLADDTDRSFVNLVSRISLGVDEYPYESRNVARTVITIRPERFVMPKVHGS